MPTTADYLSGVEITGPTVVFASRADVTSLAANAVAQATLAAADLLAARTGEPLRPVRVDRTAACAAFAGERLFQPIGWKLPPIWDPIAGDYRSADGWIRLHTNYSYHRAATLRALGLPAECQERAEAAAAVVGRQAIDLESAVVAEGGAAAALRSPLHWSATAAGQAAAQQRLWSESAPPAAVALPPADRPLHGVRVLDLTRVIAGPVCTRFLAAYGAQVLRVDPPGFTEVPALVPEVTAGKLCSTMDLRAPEDRARFAGLVGQAHVVVGGLRDGALQGLGFGPDRLRELNPGLILARLDAYGWHGPWAGRRGFDSLVQMSCGIAFLDDHSAPSPLPVQALDHATGYLLAAAVCRALSTLVRTGVPADIRTSLVATANRLISLPAPGSAPADEPAPGSAPPDEPAPGSAPPDEPAPGSAPADQPAPGSAPPDEPAPGARAWPTEVFETVDTAWGPARRVRMPGSIEGIEPAWAVDAGPLGRHEPTFG